MVLNEEGIKHNLEGFHNAVLYQLKNVTITGTTITWNHSGLTFTDGNPGF